jgi:hypothetical protein
MTAPDAHPGWCARDVTAEFDGTEHVSRRHQWRPVYEHEAAIVDELRQVVYADGGAETPAAIVRIDNPGNPGEVAMTADDLAAFVAHLANLRTALVAESEPSRP